MQIDEAKQILEEHGYSLIDEKTTGLSIEDYRDIVEDWLVRASKGAVDRDRAEELASEYGEEICGAYDAGFTCQEEAEDILYNEGIL